MREPLAIRDPRHRVMRLWLWSIAALIFAMVLVGGATRLTESGLSITEWQPVTGTLPPLSDAAWNADFEKYKAIPQYQLRQSRDEPRRVQDDLLVGMDAPPARPADRRRLPAAVPVVLVARLARARAARPAVG